MISDYDYSKIENYDELRKLQLTQLEILKYVDKFCKDNDIKYSVAYGTMIGAIRHGGFIPWDDDMDICMLRADYDKFIRLWKDTDRYLLQNHNTEKSFTQSFTKIRMKNTAFVQETDLGKNFHKGIFIDIFPLDRVPNGNFKRMIQMIDAMKYNLYMRGYAPKDQGIFTFVSNIILKTTRKSKYEDKIKKYYKKMCRYNSNNNFELADMSVFETIKAPYQNNLMDKFVDVRFEDAYVMITSEYLDLLTTYYGDYMKLPQESEQTWSHHPFLIDFDKEYAE